MDLEVEEKKPSVVSCRKCGHSWIGFYLPMPIGDAVRVMKNLTCPKCAADSKQIVVFDGSASSATELK
jgi:predicted nucleic-acid-binding Zn-ribbon protein